MTHLMTTPPPPLDVGDDPVGGRPDAPFPPPGPADERHDLDTPGGGDSRKRSRRGGGWRFTGGLVTGLAVSALVAGAVVLIDDDDSADDDAAPAAEVVADEGDGSDPAVTVVPPGSSVHDLVVAVRPSIVAIHTTVSETTVFGERVQGEAAGSGFVLSADGYVVTNNHVIDEADEITVTFDDGSREPAELVGADPRSDLAVLHVERTDLTPLALGDSDAIRVGDPVVAIGNALDLGAEPTVTAGLVSAKERTITEPNGQILVDLIQTDAAISPGNSGGPLLDMNGRVVGINTAVAGQGQNIGFAISINRAKVLIDQLREGTVPRHALLGVTTRPTPTGDGAVVVSVERGSAADESGLRAGDVITRIGDDVVENPRDLAAAIATRQPGDVVEITFERDGRERQVTAELGAHDEANS